MAQHIVKVLDAEFINYSVKRFIVEKPENFSFIPGQGVEVAINLPEWKDKFRTFSFTNLTSQNYLELIIKIYSEHKDVTNEMSKINAGAEFILKEPYGAVTYKGPGVFLAGGVGITPFLAIFRQLYKDNALKGNKLIYSNRTVEDVIMYQELQNMLKNDLIPFFSHENIIGFGYNRIDRKFLIATIRDFSQYFYLCGPKNFVKDISEILLDLGANVESLVVEE